MDAKLFKEVICALRVKCNMQPCQYKESVAGKCVAKVCPTREVLKRQDREDDVLALTALLMFCDDKNALGKYVSHAGGRIKCYVPGLNGVCEKSKTCSYYNLIFKVIKSWVKEPKES